MKKVDSKHETYFEWWAEEAKELGYIEKYYRSATYRLLKETEEFEAHKYTPDYTIIWTDKALREGWVGTAKAGTKGEYFKAQPFKRLPNVFYTVVDIKPDKARKHMSTKDTTFPIDQKLMLVTQTIYVQKLVLYPASNSKNKRTLFQIFWTPKKYIEQEVYKKDCKWGKKGESKIKWSRLRDMDQFLTPVREVKSVGMSISMDKLKL